METHLGLYFFCLLIDDLIMMTLSKLFDRTDNFISHKNFFYPSLYGERSRIITSNLSSGGRKDV
ncbi:MAG: hypothetical protein AMJ89_03240 [candidate division Zixibacteria bacterium SM23_73]|nr:MAG: hypothetical protein AMJ89_03240 [candidate division Zixibacteria bacterium SM23_73]